MVNKKKSQIVLSPSCFCVLYNIIFIENLNIFILFMVIIMSLSTFCAITVSVSDKRIYLLMHAIIHHVSSPLSHILKRSYLCLHAFSTLIFFLLQITI